MAAPGYERAFNRYELKYVIGRAEAERFVGELGEYLRPDPHAGPAGSYGVSSLYYDSPDLTCFYEKLDGLRFRRKLRLRRYDADDPGQAFLEIKQREDRTVQKRRVRLALDEVFQLLPAPAGWEPPAEPGDDPDEPVVREAQYLVAACDLRPRLVVAYTRRPLLAVHEQGLRITVDTDLRCWDEELAQLGTRPGEGTYVLPPDRAVLEIKFNDVVPLWLTRHVAGFECTLRRISKYCEAVDRLVFQGAMI